MATWVRQGTGTAPSTTNSDLVGTYELDNATAPGDFDPAGVTSVRFQYRITGTNFNDADDWHDLRRANVTLDGDGTNIAAVDGTDNNNLKNTFSDTDETDNSPLTDQSTAGWEGAELNAPLTGSNGYTSHNQDKGPDGGVQTMSALTVTITYTPAVATTLVQANFRIRSGDTVGLNVDSGWAADLNVGATIDLETRFRIRFEIDETSGNSDTDTYELWASLESGAYVKVPTTLLDWQVLGATTRIGHVDSKQYANSDPTTDVLSGADAFTAGDGVEEAGVTDSITLNAQHTEIEFCLLLHRIADGPLYLNDLDTIDFRVRRADDSELDTYTNTPRVTVNHPAGLVGGNYIEDPNVIGPFEDGNGNKYVMMEAAETDRQMVMMKSADGDIWAEQDGAGRPVDVNLEGVHVIQDAANDRLLVFHHPGNTPKLHIFNTSDHPTVADDWSTIDEDIDTALLDDRDEGITAHLRSDGSIVCAYSGDTNGTQTNFDVWCNIRSSGGTWGTPFQVWNLTNNDNGGVTGVLGDNDHVYLFGCDNTAGDLYGKRINGSTDAIEDLFGTASSATVNGTTVDSNVGTAVSDRHNHTPPQYWNDGADKIFIAWQDDTDNDLEGVVITVGGGGSVGTVGASVNDVDEVANGYGGSRMPLAHIIRHSNGDFHAFFATDPTTGSINNNLKHDVSTDDGATWTTDDLVTVRSPKSRINWVRAYEQPDGNIGLLYHDASGTEQNNSSTGGDDTSAIAGMATGFIWYDEYPVATAQLIAVGTLAETDALVPIPIIQGQFLSVGTLAETNRLVGRRFGHVALDGKYDFMQAADKAVLDITGDIELIALVAPDVWIKGVDDQAVIGKWVTTGSQRSYGLAINAAGRIAMKWTADGSSNLTQVSAVLPGGVAIDGQHLWIRATLDVSVYLVSYYYSTDPIDTPVGSVSWTAFGTDSGAATSIHLGTAPMELGSLNAGTASELRGKIYGAWVYDGIGGTLVADPDFRRKDHKDFVYFDGTADKIETSDKAALDVTGDLELICLAHVDVAGSTQGLIDKTSANAGYGLRVNPANGGIQLMWGDGTTTHFKSQGDSYFTAGTDVWFRGTLDVDDGASQHVWSLFVSTDPIDTHPLAVNWTAAGSGTEVAGTTSIANATGVLRLGQRDSEFLEGRIYGAWVYDGLVVDGGTLVADPDFREDQTDYVFLDGTNDYVETADKATLDITGDIEIVFLAQVEAGASNGTVNKFFSNNGYRFLANQTDQSLQLAWGTGATEIFHGTATGLFNLGEPTWFRATLDVNDGASGHRWDLYISTDPIDTPVDEVNWGVAVAGATESGVTSIGAGTTVLALGEAEGNEMLGRFYGAWIYDGIGGTLVAGPDFREPQTPYVFFDGTDDELETADKAQLDITGDIEIVALVAPDDATPAADQAFVSKSVGGGDQRSYRFYMNGSGNLLMQTSTNGIAVVTQTSSVIAPFVDGQPLWVRVTVDVDNGASNADYTFWTSDDPITTPIDSVSWTQLGAVQNPGATTSIFPGTAELIIGARTNTGTDPFAGKIYAAWVYDGIGGTRVANPDFRDTRQGDWAAPPVTDDDGNSWAFNGNADWGQWPDGLNSWDFIGNAEWGQWGDTKLNSFKFIDDAEWGQWPDETQTNTWAFQDEAYWLGGETLPHKVVVIGVLAGTDSLVAIAVVMGSGQDIAVTVLAETESLIAVAAEKLAPIGVLAELDSLLAIGGLKTATIGTLPEVDALIAVGAEKLAAIGVLSETDTLIAIEPVKPIITAVGVLAEINALAAIAAEKFATIGVLAETDTLVAVAAEKFATIGTLAEIDSLIPAGVSQFKTIGTLAEVDALIAIAAEKFATIGTLTEADSLIAIEPVKPIITAVGVLAEIDALIAVAVIKLASIGVLSETDSLVSIAAEKFATIGTLAETDTLLPILPAKFANIGVLAETDTLIPVDPVKPIITGVGILAEADALIPVQTVKVAVIGTLAETDTLILAEVVQAGQVIAVTVLAETDSLIVVQPIKVANIGTLSETDALIAIEPVKPIIASVGTFAETDTLNAISGLKTVPVGTLAELDSLLAVAGLKVADIGTLAEVESLIAAQALKVALVGTLAETDALIPIEPVKPIITAVGVLSEAETLIAIAAEKIANVGVLAETDTLIAVDPVKPIITSVGVLAEADSLIAVAAEKLASIGTLAETDALIAIEAIKSVITDVGVLAETDALIAIAIEKLANIGVLAETDALVAIDPVKPIITTVGVLSEIESLIAAAAQKIVNIGVLPETDLLIPIDPVKPIFTQVGILLETDSLISVQAIKIASIGTLAEVDALVPISGLKIADVGTLSETDSLLPVALIQTQVVPVATLAELDALIAIAGLKTVDVGTLAEIEALIAAQSIKVANIGTLTEVDSMVAIQAVKDIITSVGVLAEIESLLPVGGLKTVLIGVIAEIESLIGISGIKTADVGVLTEVDTLIPVSVGVAQTIAVTVLAELDALIAVGGIKTADIGTLAEIEALVAAAPVKPIITGVGVLAETDSLLTIAGLKVAQIGTLAEIESLLAIQGLKISDIGTIAEIESLLSIDVGRRFQVGTLPETDVLLPVQPIKIAPIGTIAELDSLLAIAAVKPIITTVGTLGQIDALQSIGAVSGISVGTLSEIESLIAIGGIKTVDVGTLVEVESLLAVAGFKTISVGTLTELDELLPVQPFKAAPIGTLGQTDSLISVQALKPIIQAVGTLGETDVLIGIAVIVGVPVIFVMDVVSGANRSKVTSAQYDSTQDATIEGN